MVGRDKARGPWSATTSTTPWSRLAEVTAFCSSIAHPVASVYLGRKSYDSVCSILPSPPCSQSWSHREEVSVLAQHRIISSLNLRTIPKARPEDCSCTLCWYAAHPQGGIPPASVDGCCYSHLIWTATRHRDMPATQHEAEERWRRYVAGGRP